MTGYIQVVFGKVFLLSIIYYFSHLVAFIASSESYIYIYLISSSLVIYNLKIIPHPNRRRNPFSFEIVPLYQRERV